MCGIAGIWSRDGALPLLEDLNTMGAALTHRGPDDHHEVILGSCGLAHRRLSIIDLTDAGRQPMTTPDGRFTLVFNGEVYNYRQLAERYLSNVRLGSTSDTEVLLHLLAQRGVETLTEVRGMFALAMWDAKEEQLLLARDPFGKKPLFYSLEEGEVRFASEPKALLEVLEGNSPPLDRRAATSYFLYEYPPSPRTMWEGIQQLPAGSWMRISKSSTQTGTHWQPKYFPKNNESEVSAAKKLDSLLRQAVERRLVADVPVGLFLSGGLDSATVGWYVSELTEQPMHSFSVGFADPEFDELPHARRVAEHLGLQHHETIFGIDEFKAGVERLVSLVDMPLADASLLPTDLVSQLASEYVKVVLDGDGSDELLGGYGTFKAARAAEMMPFRTQLAPFVQEIVALMPTHMGNFTWDFVLKAFARGLSYPLHRRNAIWLGSFTELELKSLLQSEFHGAISSVFEAPDAVAAQFTDETVVDRVSALTINGYLTNDILTKLDRATMYSSVEARTPFLDTDLADYIMRLPDAMKKDKYILKHLMRDRLPAGLVDRPKKGFGIPLGMWLQGPLADWASDIMNADKLKQQGVLNADYVQRLLREHQQGRADHRKKLWTLLSWQLWYDYWVIGKRDRS